MVTEGSNLLALKLNFNDDPSAATNIRDTDGATVKAHIYANSKTPSEPAIGVKLGAGTNLSITAGDKSVSIGKYHPTMVVYSKVDGADCDFK
jgi:hypothetical protein